MFGDRENREDELVELVRWGQLGRVEVHTIQARLCLARYSFYHMLGLG